MKRTHYSFMEENPNPNNNLIHMSNQQNPAFSGKRNKHSDVIDLVGSQSMQAVGGYVSIPQMDNLGHERLKSHQEEVAGHVVIPDSWGQEELLKDWIDYSPFDALLVPEGLTSAREALAMEGRRANTSHGVLRIESRKWFLARPYMGSLMRKRVGVI
ncbi:uncharacterized protein LOC125470444 [Pyrus x bretschneideri]|uniref:uncharacterized protein LOC125470444 n=1 Tax=Pyrus x bretschneideri TaxID=225117 RepID=UPI00202EBA9E|nr:uncharacterized protein LOC125470444 [Pyrus x bretschneideri]